MSDKDFIVPVKSPEELKREFELDTEIVAEQTSKYVSVMQPAYMLSEARMNELVYDNAAELLDAVTFLK